MLAFAGRGNTVVCGIFIYLILAAAFTTSTQNYEIPLIGPLKTVVVVCSNGYTDITVPGKSYIAKTSVAVSLVVLLFRDDKIVVPTCRHRHLRK